MKLIPPLRGYASSVIYWWTPAGDACAPYSARIPNKEQNTAAHLFDADWPVTRYIQFMIVSQSTTEGLRQNFPEVPYLGDVDDTSDDKTEDLIDSPISPPSVTDLPPASPPSVFDLQLFLGSEPEDDTMTCESDLDVDPTNDLIVRSRLAPRDALKREQHRRLVRRMSKRAQGPGPIWRLQGFEQAFLNSLSWMRRSPDAEFMVPGHVSFLSLTDEPDNYVQLYLDPDISKLVEGMHHSLDKDVYMVFGYGSRPAVASHGLEIYISQPCIEREADSLTPEQLKTHAKEVDEACLSELRKWVNLGALKIRNRAGSPNIMDSRWVIRFKRMPDSSLIVKSRLCIRGSKDGQIEMLDTFAGTASRYGQRAVNIVAATKRWLLWSLDVSQAFLKGLTFEEVSQMTGTPLRSVQLTLPKGAAAILQKLPGYEKFDPLVQVLDMVRPGFGLKDAPRLRHLRIDEVMKQIGAYALVSDPQLYARRRSRRGSSCLSEASYSFDALDPYGHVPCCSRYILLAGGRPALLCC